MCDEITKLQQALVAFYDHVYNLPLIDKPEAKPLYVQAKQHIEKLRTLLSNLGVDKTALAELISSLQNCVNKNITPSPTTPASIYELFKTDSLNDKKKKQIADAIGKINGLDIQSVKTKLQELQNHISLTKSFQDNCAGLIADCQTQKTKILELMTLINFELRQSSHYTEDKTDYLVLETVAKSLEAKFKKMENDVRDLANPSPNDLSLKQPGAQHSDKTIENFRSKFKEMDTEAREFAHKHAEYYEQHRAQLLIPLRTILQRAAYYNRAFPIPNLDNNIEGIYKQLEAALKTKLPLDPFSLTVSAWKLALDSSLEECKNSFIADCNRRLAPLHHFPADLSQFQENNPYYTKLHELRYQYNRTLTDIQDMLRGIDHRHTSLSHCLESFESKLATLEKLIPSVNTVLENASHYNQKSQRPSHQIHMEILTKLEDEIVKITTSQSLKSLEKWNKIYTKERNPENATHYFFCKSLVEDPKAILNYPQFSEDFKKMANGVDPRLVPLIAIRETFLNLNIRYIRKENPLPEPEYKTELVTAIKNTLLGPDKMQLSDGSRSTSTQLVRSYVIAPLTFFSTSVPLAGETERFCVALGKESLKKLNPPAITPASAIALPSPDPHGY